MYSVIDCFILVSLGIDISIRCTVKHLTGVGVQVTFLSRMFQWRAHALHNDCVTLTNVDSRQLLVIGKYLIYIFVVRQTPWIKVLNEEIPARDLKFA